MNGNTTAAFMAGTLLGCIIAARGLAKSPIHWPMLAVGLVLIFGSIGSAYGVTILHRCGS